MTAAANSCSGCEAPVAPDQRYCLNCGERVGERRLDPLALLHPPELPEAAMPAPQAAGQTRWSPRALGGSALALLVGGALMGAAFAPGPAGSLAAAAGQVIVVSAPVAPAVRSASGGGGPTATFAPSEPPVPAPPPPVEPANPAPAVPAAAPEPVEPAPPAPEPEPEPPAPEKRSIGHVYVVVLPAAADPAAVFEPYLSRAQLLTGFKPVADDPAINRIALVSGQDANAEFPPETTSLAEQLGTWGFEWRAYVEGMEQPCRHPDALDPFASFHSIVDRGDCAQHLLPLDNQFDPKPMFSFLAPLAAEGLETWLDPILESKPYKKDGLVVVMFDNEPQALVLSPFVEAGSTNDKPYDSYSVLKTIEDRIGLGEHLGHADDEGVHAFGEDVFSTELDPYQDPEGL